jgi:ABC-type sugar transport system permease subunit
VLSVVVLGLLYQEVLNTVYPSIMKTVFNKTGVASLMTPNSPYNAKFYGALIFTLWFSFGSNVLIYTGAMSGIDQSVVESAHLDGVNSFQEFLYIYVPMVFSTIATFILTGLAGIFNNQMNLHVFFKNGDEVEVFGYHFYSRTAMYLEQGMNGHISELHELAALGVIATLIIIPVTLLARKLLNKYGPSTD